MNNNNFTVLILAACLLSAAFSPPAAGDSGPYLAADLGRSHFNGGIFDNGISSPGQTTSVNDTASAHRFTLGYQFTQYWGVEAGYVDLGSGSFSYRDKPSMGFTAVGTQSVSAHGYFVIGTGSWPVDQQWSLYARAGTIGSTVDYHFACNTGDCALFSSQQTSGAGATYGVGAKWNVWSHMSLRLGWDHYRNLGDASYKANLLALGVEWHFD